MDLAIATEALTQEKSRHQVTKTTLTTTEGDLVQTKSELRKSQQEAIFKDESI
eukprot:TRINITY_DN8049_c0_g1_i1.p4 TRINITY_DN8049_c0_g1~~TRINITY_DN8049_c0_g1_i1.p4  ORF type:complete len:53 (-),score=15.97 TRINITY_DN8049_c0_g1_i1:82-240(-)